MGITVDEADQIDLPQQLFDPGAFFVARASQTERHVVLNAQMRKQRKILKHQPDFAAFRWNARDGVAHQFAIDVNLARILHLNARDHPQGG